MRVTLLVRPLTDSPHQHRPVGCGSVLGSIVETGVGLSQPGTPPPLL